jgi:hypothetical protein
VAREGGDKVLQLEEGMGDVRDDLAEGKRGTWGRAHRGRQMAVATRNAQFLRFFDDGDGRGAVRACGARVMLKEEKRGRKGGDGAGPILNSV